MTGRASALHTVPGLRDLAIAQNGVVRRDQLARLGVTPGHTRSQIDAERWRALGPFVVVLRNGRLLPEQWRAVGVLHAAPEAHLAGRTALELAGLRGWPDDVVHVLVPRSRRVPPLAGIRVRRVTSLDPCDLQPVPWPPRTTAARAALDAAAAERSPRTASALVLAALQQRVVRPDDLLEALGRLATTRHAALLRRVVHEGHQGAESHAELDAVRLLRRAGLGALRRQVVIETPSGAERVDLLVTLPDGRLLVLEVDGPHHLDPLQRRRDLARDAALIALGYVVLRIPAAELRSDPRRVLEQLRRLAQAA